MAGHWTTAEWIANAALVAVLLVGAYTDLRWRRLPNWLTLGGAAFGLALQTAGRGLDGGRDGLIGWLVGCALLFLPFAFGAMGAGDVKLLGAIGALRGASFVLSTFVFMGLAGGMLALTLLVRRGALIPLLKQTFAGLWVVVVALVRYRSLPASARFGLLLPMAWTGTMSQPAAELKVLGLPYGIAIAAGGLFSLMSGY